MTPHILLRETFINRPLEEVFDFFSAAENLNLLTPPNVNFKIITPLPIIIKKGAFIDYRIKVSGIPFQWRTEITAWEKNKMFCDEQRKGPYKIWKHTHSFKAVNNGTQMTDEVQYLSPGWILEPMINALFIKHKVAEIFDYREIALKQIFK
jgi:ligand-binding SRPBCC domain-containing protein